jgi:hypothetical protein
MESRLRGNKGLESVPLMAGRFFHTPLRRDDANCFHRNFFANRVSIFAGGATYVIQLFTILLRGLLKTMAKQPSASHSERRSGTAQSVAQDKKKRLADALRRNLAKRKTNRGQGAGSKPNAG